MQVKVWLSFVLSLLLCGAGTGLQAATTVTLGNGDYLVVDPDYDAGSVQNVGRVQVYYKSGTLATTVYGSQANDRVGSGGAVALGSSSYVICSPEWDNGPMANVGALTPGYMGLNFLGPVAVGNSWTGSTAGDFVGNGGITKVGANFCAVRSPLWDNGAVSNAGAISCFYAGVNYTAQTISAANSLVGASADDQLGSGGVMALGTTHFAVRSPLWDNGLAQDAGALSVGLADYHSPVGVVTASNSVVGSKTSDQIGSGGVSVVASDYLLIHSPLWDNGPVADAGAVSVRSIEYFHTSVGAISAANSLVGSSSSDQIGSGGVTVLGTSYLLIRSPLWNNGVADNAGAVSVRSIEYFYAGVGAISATNSVVGSSAGDQAGSGAVTQVGTDYLLIHSPLWDNGSISNAGAVSLRYLPNFQGMTISAANSLVGGSANDQVGSGGLTLVGTNYVLVRSPLWDNGAAADAGAVSIRYIPNFQGATVAAANSLVGTSSYDQVGSGGLTLVGTDYVLVRSPLWDNGGISDAGAVSIRYIPNFQGAAVSATNSVVGASAYDQVGSGGLTLSGSTYVLIRSPNWDNGAVGNAGAVSIRYIPNFQGMTVSATNSVVGASASDQVGSGGLSLVGDYVLIRSPLWDNATTAASDAGAVTVRYLNNFQGGVVSATNSLVGSTASDQIGSGGITALGTTAYLIRSPLWNHSGVADAGAVTYGTTASWPTGVVSRMNSLVGSHANDQISSGGITTAGGGTSYTISSPNWCNGAGASTPGTTSVWIYGVVDSSNSTVGAESLVPEILIQQPAPTEVANNGSRSFGTATVGGTQSLSFVVRNTGTDDLWLYGGATRVSLSGTDAAQFRVVAQPDNFIIAGGSLGFTVEFKPTTEGAKTARISITNNDSNESTYRIDLTGTALSQVAGWRQTHFGSSANSGAGADSADFDKDGIPNLVEYALGLHPAQSTTGQLPPAVIDGENFAMSFNEPAGMSGVAYGAEWSPSLVGGSWQAVTAQARRRSMCSACPGRGTCRCLCG